LKAGVSQYKKANLSTTLFHSNYLILIARIPINRQKYYKSKDMATKKVTYKEAITEIEEILEKIESEELDVDELAEQVSRVSALIAICKDKLHKTEEEVEKILKEMDK
jgi:exodeoxyribonuclease VII small subunit